MERSRCAMTAEQLIRRQVELEEKAHLEAKLRYSVNKSERRDFNQNPGANAISDWFIAAYKEELDKWFEDKKGGRGGVEKRYFRELGISSLDIAITGVSTVVSLLCQKRSNKTLISLANKIYEAVMNEVSYQELMEWGLKDDNLEKHGKGAQGWKRLSKKITNELHDRYQEKRIQILRHARNTLTDLQEVPEIDKVKGGLALLNRMLSASAKIGKDGAEVSFLKTTLIHHGRTRKEKLIEFTPSVEEFLMNADTKLSDMAFSCYPMVCPPDKWTGLYGGGYITPRGKGARPLVRSKMLHEIEQVGIPNDILEIVNNIQEVPWRVNLKVLAVMQYCAKNGIEMKGIPVMDHTEQLKRASNEEWEGMSQDDKKAYTQARRDIHKKDTATRSRKHQSNIAIQTAERFVNYEQLYFPHSLDFRGRIYPMASALSPQGDTVGKNLLEFSTAKALGHSGRKWLAVHGANCFGHDKLPISERQQWTERSEEKIRAISENPLRALEEWRSADDPWGFLAFCFEWAEMLSYTDPSKFKSRIPVRLDATSSGLQHYSALLLDEVGAKATNIIGEERSDIYGEVAEQSKVLIKQELTSVKEIEERNWKHLIAHQLDRSVCKPITMTMPYGVSKFGASDQFEKMVSEGDLKVVERKEDEKERGGRCRWLAETCMDAVGQVVTAAPRAMKWIQQCEREMPKDTSNGFLRYESPLGFPVIQAYYKSRLKRVNTFLGTQRLQVGYRENTNKVDGSKSNAGAPPNIVHTLDATHLMMVSKAATEAGIPDQGYIHDSFATHPSETEEYSKIIREQFIALYSTCQLQRMKEQWEERYGIELPEVPEKGSLVLGEVLDQEYFFS